MPNLKHLARNMRNAPTDAENKLWYHLSRKQLLGLKFRRQVPVGDYIVDFLSYDVRLIIELDGGQHNDDRAIEYDRKRTEFLEAQGFLVVRFWNHEIFENLEGVLETIINIVNPLLNPPPQGEEMGTPTQKLKTNSVTQIKK